MGCRLILRSTLFLRRIRAICLFGGGVNAVAALPKLFYSTISFIFMPQSGFISEEILMGEILELRQKGAEVFVPIRYYLL
jgi:hypothetical protein